MDLLEQLVLTPSGEVPLSSLKAGDLVVSQNGVEQVSSVDHFYERENKCWLVVNDKYKFAPHQTIYADGTFIHAKDLKPSMFLQTQEGKKLCVLTVKKIEDKSLKIKLLIDRKKSIFNIFRKNKATHTYYLNGILVHNASRFWVGHTGNWSATTSWSTVSGGASGAAVPTSSDDAIFDGNSFNAAGQTCTIDVSSNCANWDCSAVTNTPNFALTNYLFTHGNITFSANMTTQNTSGFFLQIFGSGAYNINFAGVALNWNVTFNDVGTYTLTGALTDTNSSCRVLLQKGTLNLNGQTVNVYQFSCDGSTNTRTLNMNASSVTATVFDFSSTTGLTFNAGTSTLTINGGGTFTSNGLTYYNLVLNGSYTISSGTFNQITDTGFTSTLDLRGTTVTTVTLQNTCSNFYYTGTLANINTNSQLVLQAGSFTNVTCNNGADLTVNTGSSSITNLTCYENTTIETGLTLTNLTCNRNSGKITRPTVFMANMTVSGTFTASGFSQTDRGFIAGRTYNNTDRTTKVTITAATVSISNVDFQLITGAGAGTWSGTSIGDMGENSGITFTTPVTRYWVGNGGNWTDTTHWSATSGGASGATMPLPQDTVKIDANSISLASQTIAMNIDHTAVFDTTGCLNNPTVDFSVSGFLFLHGSTLNISAVTTNGSDSYSVYLVPSSGNDMTVTCGGKSFAADLNLNGTGTGTMFLADDFYILTSSATDGDFGMVSGHLVTNNHNMHMPSAYFNWNAPCTIDFGTSTIYMDEQKTSYSAYLDFSNANNTVHATQCTIVFNNTVNNAWFYPFGYTFHNVQFGAGGTVNQNISGNNGGIVGTFDLLQFTGNSQNITIPAGAQINTAAMTLAATAGNQYSLSSSNGGSQANLNVTGAPFQWDYVTIQDINALVNGSVSPTPYVYAGTNSINTSNNSGIFFDQAAAPLATLARKPGAFKPGRLALRSRYLLNIPDSVLENLFDAVAGSDSLSILVATPLADTGASTDALTTLLAMLGLSDTAHGVETLSALLATFGITDTSSSSDLATILNFFSLADIAEGQDARRNLALGPSFEDTSGWGISNNGLGGTVTLPSTDFALFGTHSAKVVNADSTNTSYLKQTVTVVPGHTYVFSCYVKVTNYVSNTGGVKLLTTDFAQVAGQGFNGVQDWTRYSCTYTVPATGMPSGVSNQMQLVLDWLVGTYYFDGALLEDRTDGTVQSFFDGNTANAYWEGTQYNSASALPATTPFVSVQLPITETGHGTEALSLSATFPLADTCTGVDSITAFLNSFALSDSAISSDILSALLNSFPLADTNHSSDAVSLLALFTLPDSSNASEVFTSLLAGLPIADSSLGSEGISIANFFPLADTAHAADTPSILAMFSLTDAGSSSDTVWFVLPVSTDHGVVTGWLKMQGDRIAIQQQITRNVLKQKLDVTSLLPRDRSV